MVSPELLKILCCPETHQDLRLADPAQIELFNKKIKTGALKNRAGNPVNEPIEGGLIRADAKFLYPIRKQIPVLLTEEAIPLE